VQNPGIATDRSAAVGSVTRSTLPQLTDWRASVLLASLTVNFLSLGLPIVILQVYDRIVPNASTETLGFLVLGLSVAMVFDGLLRVGRAYMSGWTGARFEHAAGCLAVNRLLGANLQSSEKDPVGVQLDRLNAVDTLRDFYTAQAPLVLVDLPFVVLFLILIYAIAGPLVFVPLAILALLAITAAFYGNRLRDAITARAATDERRYSFVIEMLTGIHTVKSMAMETLMLRRYERLVESASQSIYDATFSSNMSLGFGILASQITMVAVSASGSVLVVGGDLSVGGLAACTLLAGRTMQPLMRAMGIWRQFQAARVGQDRLASLYDLESEGGDRAEAPLDLQGHIEVRDVRFGYGDDEGQKPMFDGVSFEARAGETIGIRGGNGVGKSTLLWLLTGALRPDAGQVLFDGRDAADWNPLALRDQIAYVPQKGVLFEGTLMDNLTMFRSKELSDKAAEMAERLGLDSVVAQLPRGFETRTGDTTVESLPGGVRQQIAIVRSLLDDKRIILFDEANTSLDQRADARLQEMLKAEHGRRTIILVSYRPSVLKLADRIYELANGRLVEVADNRPSAHQEPLPESKAVKLKRALKPRARVAAEKAALANHADAINEKTVVSKAQGEAGSG